MAQASPLFLGTRPDGSAVPVFPGGVELPTQDTATLGTPPVNGAIRWVRQQDGLVPGSTGGLSAYMIGTSDSPSYRNGLAAMVSVAPAGPGRAALIAVSRSAPDSDSLSVQITTPSGGQETATILDDTRRSRFLQLASTANLQVQTFRAVVNNIPAGFGTYLVNLPAAWVNNHLYVIGSLSSVSLNWNVGTMGFQIPNLSQIQVVVTANPILQNMTFDVMSFGN